MKVFDGHSDILMDVVRKGLMGEEDILRKYHIEKLRKGQVFTTVFALWLDPNDRMNGRKNVLQMLEYAEREFRVAEDIFKKVTKYEEISQEEAKNRVSVILGLESMFHIDNNLDLIQDLYERGIRYGSLTWNEENQLATGIAGDLNRGLTKLGIDAIKVMEEVGVLLDVSHLNEKSFWDVVKNTRKPIIASHSNAHRLCKHPRNLKDGQIKGIVETGGVIGINGWPDFVDEKQPSVEKLGNHIEYLVEMIGIEHVACGFDFCDFVEENPPDNFTETKQEMKDFHDARDIQNLFHYLKNRGYREGDMQKIAYENLLRIYREVLV